MGGREEQEYMGRLKQNIVSEYSIRKHISLGTN